VNIIPKGIVNMGKPKKSSLSKVKLVIPAGRAYRGLAEKPPPRELVLNYLEDFDRANNLKRGTVYEFSGLAPKGNGNG